MASNPLLVSLAAHCGYDFLILDGEHGDFNESDYAAALSALRTQDILGMVRLADHNSQAIAHYVEMGADAIVVPHIETAEQAAVMVRAIAPFPSTSLLIIIESAQGVANSEAILALDRVDGALIGPNDLTASLGCTRDYGCADYIHAMFCVEQAAGISGKVFGTVPHGDYTLRRLIDRGHRLIVLGTDVSIIHDGLEAKAVSARCCEKN